MKRFLRIIIKLNMFLIIFLSGMYTFSIKGYCENVVVVIDPGHGGDALGGNMDNRIERDINLITAKALKERLEQYEGIDVYITRDNNEDEDLSRKQRLDVAKDKNADFLFSIHYNMSENHTLYGSEVWIASKGTNYVKGYKFASIEMESLTSLGLFDRGIKCKLNDAKNGENYGILKYAEDYNIPAVIIEHCHLDEERDSAFWNEEGYKLLGQTDADSIAKYFKLSSASLGIDNSNFETIEVIEPDYRHDVDSTEPEYCEINLIDSDDISATIEIKASDSDTYVQYYQYSLDGGRSFSRLEAWDDRQSDSQIFKIDKTETESELIVNVYNQYEFCKLSNSITIPAAIIEESAVETDSKDYEEISITLNKKDSSLQISPVMVLLVTLISLFVLFNILFFVAVAGKSKKRRR